MGTPHLGCGHGLGKSIASLVGWFPVDKLGKLLALSVLRSCDRFAPSVCDLFQKPGFEFGMMKSLV